MVRSFSLVQKNSSDRHHCESDWKMRCKMVNKVTKCAVEKCSFETLKFSLLHQTAATLQLWRRPRCRCLRFVQHRHNGTELCMSWLNTRRGLGSINHPSWYSDSKQGSHMFVVWLLLLLVSSTWLSALQDWLDGSAGGNDTWPANVSKKRTSFKAENGATFNWVAWRRRRVGGGFASTLLALSWTMAVQRKWVKTSRV